MKRPHAIVLRIPVQDEAKLDDLFEVLAELARDLESQEGLDQAGLVPDSTEPGRYAWEVVIESYA